MSRLTGLWRDLYEFMVPGSQDFNLFTDISKKHELEIKDKDESIIIPPLIDTNQEKNLSEYYVKVAKGHKLYKFYSKYNKQEYTDLPQVYWVYQIELKRELPYFVVDSIFNEVGIDKIFYDYKQVSLEGDFSEYFKVYIPTNEQVDVLSVIGPDLMETIYPYWEQVDLIVAGKKAWLIAANDKPVEARVEDILNAGEAVATELEHSALSFRP